jgi:hypothetical protein
VAVPPTGPVALHGLGYLPDCDACAAWCEGCRARVGRRFEERRGSAAVRGWVMAAPPMREALPVAVRASAVHVAPPACPA